MKRIKKMMLGFIMAFAVTTAIPVTMPLCSTVITADAAVMKLHIASASITIGDTLQLKVTGTNKTVKWSSSNAEVAKVSSKGQVTGLKKGTAMITATVGSKKYKSTIQVKQKELTAAEIYEKCMKATVEIIVKKSGDVYKLGSGFFIDNGIVITNYHVVAGAVDAAVIDSSNRTYNIEQVLGYDENIDLAILKINSQNEYLEKSQEEVKPGETVYTLGSPLGLTGTLSSGMVASPIRIIENVNYIQVTAPMSPGNSGGPLLNKYGEVMGINTWQYSEGQNLNFSINISEVQKVKTDKPLSLSEFGKVTVDSTTTPDNANPTKDSGNTSRISYGWIRLSNSPEYAMVFYQ